MNQTDCNNDPAVILAIKNKHDECAKLLCEHKDIDINWTNKYGYTLLVEAATYGCAKCVEILCTNPK